MRQPTKQQLREELAARRSIGRQMSNILWNLGQGHSFSERDRTKAREIQESWDAIEKAVAPEKEGE